MKTLPKVLIFIFNFVVISYSQLISSYIKESYTIPSPFEAIFQNNKFNLVVKQNFSYTDFYHFKKQIRDTLIQDLVIENYTPSTRIVYNFQNKRLQFDWHSLKWYSQWLSSDSFKTKSEENIQNFNVNYSYQISPMTVSLNWNNTESKFTFLEKRLGLEQLIPNGLLFRYDNSLLFAQLYYQRVLDMGLAVFYTDQKSSRYRSFQNVSRSTINHGQIGFKYNNFYANVKYETTKRISDSLNPTTNNLPMRLQLLNRKLSIENSFLHVDTTKLICWVSRQTGYLHGYSLGYTFFTVDSAYLYGIGNYFKLPFDWFTLKMENEFYWGHASGGNINPRPFSDWLIFYKFYYHIHDLLLRYGEAAIFIDKKFQVDNFSLNGTAGFSYLYCKLKGSYQIIRPIYLIPRVTKSGNYTVLDIALPVVSIGISPSWSTKNFSAKLDLHQKIPLFLDDWLSENSQEDSTSTKNHQKITQHGGSHVGFTFKCNF